MGWIGSSEKLYATLEGMGCDKTGEQFHVSGAISSFLGMGQEFVVGDDAIAYVNKKAVALVPRLLEADPQAPSVVVI